MIICDTLNVTPEWILSGSSKTGNRGNELPWYVIDRSTELGRLVSQYRELDEKQRARVMGYLEALRAMDGKTENRYRVPLNGNLMIERRRLQCRLLFAVKCIEE